jgi:23S rRNA (uracil1939-C5)-methyltransferase
LSKTEEITLENAAYGGESIGRLPDGRAVFVPLSIPGELVRIRVIEDKKRYARGELLEVLQPSPFRVSPRCPHFGICGGCHYQQIAYEQQLVIKRKILKDQLERIGKITNPPVEEMIASQNPYNYRNHVQFHISPGGKPGYIRADNTGILEIDECHLPEEMLNMIWPQLEVDPQTGISILDLRLGDDDDILLMLESSDTFDAEFNIEDLPVSVVHTSPQGIQVLAGSEYTIIKARGRNFRVSAGSFFQVNLPQAEKMVAMIEELIPAGCGTVLELYAGVGLFSAFIAERVDRLVAVESSPLASEDFVSNLDEFNNVELYQGFAEKILPYLNIQPEVVVMDPPRAGVDKNVLEIITAMEPEHIMYISCDPATLARDSRRLVEGGYIPHIFTPIDLFPQTYHIETISHWTRN